MKIILNYGTHGSERVGYYVAREIKKLKIDKKILTIQVANPKAYKLKKRFIDQDLNRSFPGKPRGNYEQRLAYKLSPAIRQADVFIDIHSTTSGLRDAAIVTKLDATTKQCLQAIRPKYVLLMNATKDNCTISQAKIGISFEYGNDSSATMRRVVAGIKRLLAYLDVIEMRLPKEKTKIQYFDIPCTVKKPVGFKLTKGIKNYQLIRAGQVYATNGKRTLKAKTDFYPILFGENTYTEYFGFKGKKLTDRIG
jgi:succinylglutamate desuccinylase